MPQLEDKALAVIRKQPVTYDQLRSQLGANPDDLDAAIANLERSREIIRDRARFKIRSPAGGESGPPTAAAEAVSALSPPAAEGSGKKHCPKCQEDKPLDAFGRNDSKSDGRQAWCRPCMNANARARTQIVRQSKDQTQRIAREAADALPASPIASPAKQSTPEIAILHFEDGVRIGPMIKSSCGLSQMPYWIDLSAAQLDELTAWHLSTKKKATGT